MIIYGVQDKNDPLDTQWYKRREDAEIALVDANSYILVSREVKKSEVPEVLDYDNDT